MRAASTTPAPFVEYRPNPLTGPFYVEGAEPGDALVVRFTRVRMNRNWGWSSYRLGLYSITPESIEGIYPNRYKPGEIIKDRENVVPWDLDLDAPDRAAQRALERRSQVGISREADARMCRRRARRRLRADVEPIGSYGGNLDYNEIGEGSTVILPVYHPGALLFIGDGHALQGDGEPTGTGIETSMAVEFIVELRKKAASGTARRNQRAHHQRRQPARVRQLDESRTADGDERHGELADVGYKMEPWAAHLLIGYQGRYDIVTVAGSVALRIPKKQLPPQR